MPDRPVRAFLAIPEDPEWSESARAFVETLRPLSPEASWTRPSSWHLTLKFLGDATRAAIEEFARGVEPVAEALAPVTLAAAGPAMFPDRGPVRVLGIALGPVETLDRITALVDASEGQARRLGLSREFRSFRPHVTLARLRVRWPAAAVARFREEATRWPFPGWRARSCVLYESRLDRAGTVHTPLAKWTFREAAAAVVSR